VDFEVIVVDNASNDGSVEMVKKDFPQVTLIENLQNHGFAAANNQGINIAKGQYVLLLNSDTVILDKTIQKTVSFADAHPEAAVVGCRVLNPDRTLQPTCFMFPSILNMLLSTTYLYKLFPKSKFFGRERMTWWDRNDVREVDVVTGCFMLVRQEAIKKVGTMDERFFMYSEETDWCYRLRKAEWKILFIPDAEIIHFGGQSSKQAAAKMVLLLRGSRLLFFKKHKGPLVSALACLFIGLFFVLRIPYWFTKALLSNKRERNACLRTACIYSKGAFYALIGGRGLYRVR
jgi:GT2 family glycosyltransferase